MTSSLLALILLTGIMMISRTITSNRISSDKAFTLIELLVVLVIIATMLTVAIPYANRSGKDLKLKQESLNMVSAINYAIDLAKNTGLPTRVTIDIKNNNYSLDILAETDSIYEPIDGFLGLPHYLDKSIRVADISNFDVYLGKECLVFDPAKPWPEASISLATDETIKVITIAGSRIKVDKSETERQIRARSNRDKDYY